MTRKLKIASLGFSLLLALGDGRAAQAFRGGGGGANRGGGGVANRGGGANRGGAAFGRIRRRRRLHREEPLCGGLQRQSWGDDRRGRTAGSTSRVPARAPTTPSGAGRSTTGPRVPPPRAPEEPRPVAASTGSRARRRAARATRTSGRVGGASGPNGNSVAGRSNSGPSPARTGPPSAARGASGPWGRTGRSARPNAVVWRPDPTAPSPASTTGQPPSRVATTGPRVMGVTGSADTAPIIRDGSTAAGTGTIARPGDGATLTGGAAAGPAGLGLWLLALWHGIYAVSNPYYATPEGVPGQRMRRLYNYGQPIDTSNTPPQEDRQPGHGDLRRRPRVVQARPVRAGPASDRPGVGEAARRRQHPPVPGPLPLRPGPIRRGRRDPLRRALGGAGLGLDDPHRRLPRRRDVHRPTPDPWKAPASSTPTSPRTASSWPIYTWPRDIPSGGRDAQGGRRDESRDTLSAKLLRQLDSSQDPPPPPPSRMSPRTRRAPRAPRSTGPGGPGRRPGPRSR